MLHGAILRSPYAHARIVSIDTSAAEAHPKVNAVITGAVLEGLGLAWMPTLSYDTQAVLATDKVRFHGQEVAFVVADDHYSARDAVELIDVVYEPLTPVIDAQQALADGAPVIRDDKEGQTEQPHLRLGVRRQGRHRRRVRRRRRRRDAGHAVPAVAPRADGDVRHRRRHGPGHRQAHALVQHPGAARPPHRVRARRRPARAQDPGDRARHRRRLRQQGADLSRLRVLDRRLDRHRRAGQVDGGPLREPDVDRLRPRLPHERRDRRHARRQDRRAARRRDRRPRRVQRHRPADQVPGRLLPHLHRLATTTAPRTARSPACTPTRRPAASPTPARSASPRRSTSSSASSTASPTSSAWTRPSCG